MRKAKDLEMMDNIHINIVGTDKIMDAIKSYDNYIKEETLALSIENVENDEMTEDVLNGEAVKISIKKA